MSGTRKWQSWASHPTAVRGPIPALPLTCCVGMAPWQTSGFLSGVPSARSHLPPVTGAIMHFPEVPFWRKVAASSVVSSLLNFYNSLSSPGGTMFFSSPRSMTFCRGWKSLSPNTSEDVRGNSQTETSACAHYSPCPLLLRTESPITFFSSLAHSFCLFWFSL